ncbi:MAG: G5 domain-containing protein [Ruminococcus sp.]|nr:G5 domain-containing protein [Ruminococcus sp.]
MKKLFKISSLRKVAAITVSLSIVFLSSLLTADVVKHVKLVDGENELRLKTYSTSTSSILSQADIRLSRADEVKRNDVEDMIYIEVLRAFTVPIEYHGEKTQVEVADGTVEEALKKAQITLSENDVLNISTDTKLYDGIEIAVDELKYKSKVDEKTIDFDTVYEESDEYPLGFEEVTQQGKNGKALVTTTYKYVNGEFDTICGEVEKVTQPPVDKVVLKGTAEVSQVSNITSSTSSSGSSTSSGESASGKVDGLSYSKVLHGTATAYTASQGALTATGVPAYVGGVAVNPNIIPYGSKLYIVCDGYTYGYATAVDTGGALMSGTALVDLYMSTYDECINFGRRNVTVYVLN